MDVFSFRNELVGDYERFSRSFTRIRAKDISDPVAEAYQSGRFWPDPLIQLNPNFVQGGSIDDVVASGLLEPECAKIFRIKTPDNPFGKLLVLHRHQREAIEIAAKGASYVLTTGTGSGKSLAYFIPIVDDVMRRKRQGDSARGITAIIVYPMNALCNSQLEELDKYLRLGYGAGKEPVTFARYTGQEEAADRERIAANPPDILLTNYVMLELIMTRFLPADMAVREHANGLRFLVLDELHTYRGRQGADVAMLVRRVRERFNHSLRCVGTSATMASEGAADNRNAAVSAVASRLFGTVVQPEHVITETLEPVTASSTPIDGPALAGALAAGVPEAPTYDQLAHHPVAAWIERKLCLEDKDGSLVRARPTSVLHAADMLSHDSGAHVELCQRYLESFLLKAYQTTNEKGRNFFAFRLHQFLSGAWNAYTTLEAPGERFVTPDGQQYEPGSDRKHILFTLAFCRECGQEYLPVWAELAGGKPLRFEPRDLSERSNDDDELQFGYLMPDTQAIFNPDDVEKHYPEEWIEFTPDGVRLKRDYRRYQPVPVRVSPDGGVAGDLPAWFISGTFRFCLQCGISYGAQQRSDLSKLSGLSSEGRSSATTMLTLSALRHLIGTDLDPKAKKILAFTDNRQDASLQAGHFNDFIQILLLRGALLAATRAQPDGHLSDDVLTQQVLEQLRLDPADFSATPDAKGPKAQAILKTLRDVLGYRLYFDLQRGWRFTNPNLEQLGLQAIEYAGLVECCADEAEWAKGHALLGSIAPDLRYRLVRDLLERMRKFLCIKTIYLDPAFQEQLRNRSFNELKEPWGLSEDERPFSSAYMIPRPQPRTGRSDVRALYVSTRSAFGRRVRSQAAWGMNNPHFPKKFDEAAYNAVVDDMLRVLTTYGIVERAELDDDRVGYRINSSVLSWTVPVREDGEPQSAVNEFFRALYDNIAALLGAGDRLLHQLEAREHTAQVEPEVRQEREARFRKGIAPQRVVDGVVEPAGLPIMFCSPTMELGVDIATLNTVYMRNVPPTPANYAQRSGRAGRSGQPALVVTYCAARSPHDQYFFSDPARMVAGVVNPPTIDLANEDLVRSHLHAVWLAETGQKLGSSIRDVLDMDDPQTLALREDIAQQIGRPAVEANTAARARSILAMLADDLTQAAAPWFTHSWPEHVVNGAVARFDQTFRRWRSLYGATARQMRLAKDVLDNAAGTERQRRDAKDRFDEAYTQQSLLLDSKPSMNSDFYTYRYLASEGFLPGYNFPRLPLMAYIPGRKGAAREAFLARPRFLGLSEFGPQSIIYHEGSTYRVRYAILTVRADSADRVSARLPEQTATLCPACGYGHFHDQAAFERCVNCDYLLEGARRITNLYRIEQVATRRVTRITSDDEERQRQGYEMITTPRFDEDSGRLRRHALAFSDAADQLLEVRYGPSATLWRINLGWRRRKDQSIFGFSLDVNTGEWTKDAQAPTDAEDDAVRDGVNVQRITPYVEDTKNILIVAPSDPLSEAELVTFQYAIKRGIEQEFQLEESELAAEPLPSRDDRRVILFYEAAEGGAGVLTRLALDPTAFARIGRRALEVCHYSSATGHWRDHEDLVDTDATCEAGCYRCLLSYYNQPDHDLIDRKDETVLDLLCQLTRAQGTALAGVGPAADSFEQLLNACVSSLEREWLEGLRGGGYRLPDRANSYLQQYETCPDFTYDDAQTVVYVDGPHHDGDARKRNDAAITKRLEDAGYTVIRFPVDRATWPTLLKEFAWVFGAGKQPDAANV